MTVERFDCIDGDYWYSVVWRGDVVTGVMHNTREDAEVEMYELMLA